MVRREEHFWQVVSCFLGVNLKVQVSQWVIAVLSSTKVS